MTKSENTIILMLILILILSNRVCFAEAISYKSREILQNGDFEGKRNASWGYWYCGVDYDHTTLNSNDINMVMEMGDNDFEKRFFSQKLIIPSVLHSAQIRFRYHSKRNFSFDKGDNPVKFEVFIAKIKGDKFDIFGTIHSEVIDNSFNWKIFDKKLKKSLISKIQKVHDKSEFIFLLFKSTRLNRENEFTLSFDDISLKIDGIQKIPEMKGKIAYTKNIDGSRNAICLINPNNRKEETIWTHPEQFFMFPIGNLCWKPDGTEIAFTSSHECLYSPLMTDIYSIKPDGNGLRRITNLPSHEEILKGDYPRITVKGKLVYEDDEAECQDIVLVLEGSSDVKHIRVCDEDEEVSFEIKDVALLGDKKIFNQRLVLYFDNPKCPSGLDFRAVRGIVKWSKANIGKISFCPILCSNLGITQNISALSWSYDGSEIGFQSIGILRKVKSSGSRVVGNEFKPSGFLTGNFQWSPVSKQYLYFSNSYSSSDCGFYIATENKKPELIIKTRSYDSIPAWLPDGKGIVYVDKIHYSENIFYYDLKRKEKQQLTHFFLENLGDISISPSGQFILFERIIEKKPKDQKNLWIMDREKPTVMWQLTENGNYHNAKWSRSEVKVKNSGDACFINTICPYPLNEWY